MPLAQAGTLEANAGGAEANVAAGLASLGTPARMLTALPDNALGRKARAALGGAGVDTRFMSFGEGPMGLYFFEPPAGPRGGRVTYDRAGSVLALARPRNFDFAERGCCTSPASPPRSGRGGARLSVPPSMRRGRRACRSASTATTAPSLAGLG